MFESYVLFENKWEIDVNSIKFMGCSTKDGKSTIGKFGTGLKYAIASLLRAGVNIEIFSGKERIHLTTQEKIIWGKPFDQILMNWEETWLTTNLWVEWQLWQGFREFYANCLDEGGEKIDCLFKRQGKNWTTRIFIENTPDIKATEKYFKFTGWTLSSPGRYFSKKDSISPVKIFKEGFLVYEGDQSENSIYDYRIDDAEINEARLIENTWNTFYQVWKIIASMDFFHVNQVLEHWDYNLINAWPDLWEGWNQAQQSRGWELRTSNNSLNEKLRQLRTEKDTKYKYYHSIHGDTISMVVAEELWEVEIGQSVFNVFSAHFQRNETKKFDFDMSKNEIYINVKSIHERSRMMLIISELIENDQKERTQFCIDLLERIYPANIL